MAQDHRCATDQYAFETGNFSKFISSAKILLVDTIHIPVVVHVIYKTAEQNISYEQIQSQIDVLNEDFSGNSYNKAKIPDVWKNLHTDSKIRFHLARKDPDGNPTSGITRTQTTTDVFPVSNQMKSTATGGQDPWPDTSYLNIWVCNLANNVLGFAQYPGGSPATDGVVIHTKAFGRTGNLFAKYNKGRTATHEIGHWLNLLHIWGDADCGNDFISDTPVQKTSTSNCPSFPKVSCCNGSSNCNDPHGDMFMNYMDYTDDKCMMLFTAKQTERMRNAVQVYRPSFLNSISHIPPSALVSDLSINRIVKPTGLLCNQIHTPEAEVINTGTSATNSFTIEAGLVDGISESKTWNGNLLPGESVIVSFDAIKISSGDGVVFARILSVDDFEFNNYLTAGYIRVEAEYGCTPLDEKPVITITPNPASGFIHIQSSFKLSNKTSIKIVDISGKALIEKEENSTEGFDMVLNIYSLSQGIYFVYVLTDTKESAAKFVKINE